jgi:uncharacterized protein (TIGR03643 family)
MIPTNGRRRIDAHNAFTCANQRDRRNGASDHVSFTQISAQHGVSPDEVKALMRTELKPGSYRAWRKRVRDFGDRRAHYK